MKKKKIYLTFFISLIILFCNSFCYASESETQAITSFNTETTKINSKFYLILNLSNINYNKFRVEITNTANLSANNLTENVLNLSSNNSKTSFVIDKSLLNLDQIGIIFTSPSQKTNIEFSTTITNLDVSIDSLQEQIQSLQQEVISLQTTLNNLNNSLSELVPESEEYISISTKIETTKKSIEEKNNAISDLNEKINNFKEETLAETNSISVVENDINQDSSENTKKPWQDDDSMLNKMNEQKDKLENMSMRKMMEQMSELEFNLKNANDTISSLTKTETYQGSQNNYLSNLSINGINFKNDFKKTTLNYFATVESNVSNVTVNAKAEDTSAVVNIYGNNNLQTGKNKILVTVTADDGSIRTYKIYLTKQ